VAWPATLVGYASLISATIVLGNGADAIAHQPLVDEIYQNRNSSSYLLLARRRKSMNQSRQLSRRQALGGLTGAFALGLPLVEAGVDADAPAKKLKVIAVGAHPDDPESGAGGTLARYADLGHETVCLYLTRGEAGMKRKTHEEAAAIRSAEAQKACQILKARPLFAGQIDGGTEVNNARYQQFFTLLDAEKPDVVFTHWPIDTHRDHRTVSLLVHDAWLKAKKRFALFYFEVDVGAQTQLFHPTHYVDITATEQRKRDACYAHSDGHNFYPQFHDVMNRFRGLQCSCKFAEAFVRHHGTAPELVP
jgi:LmbE family N-acetylglucosaminyl deacetylase